ncbi:hypothetical protein [Niallia sp. FSL R7-0271]|uniref:hypothetical protein n=1 Tax=Niallia sp. FSL R7-0271 TaxID=2921678 RepID=UPI0030FBF912
MASIERKKMDNALKQVVIPILREQDFKGSLPHFRRINYANPNHSCYPHRDKHIHNYKS